MKYKKNYFLEYIFFLNTFSKPSLKETNFKSSGAIQA